MSTIDEIGRRAGDAARADAAAHVDADRGLARIRTTIDAPAGHPAHRRRTWGLVAAVAVTVGAIAAGVALVDSRRGGQSDVVTPSGSLPTVSPPPAPTTAPSTAPADRVPPPASPPPTSPIATTVPTTQGASPAAGEVIRIAEAIGATELVVRSPGVMITYADGVIHEARLPETVSYAMTNGEFSWWEALGADDEIRSVVATRDGTVVCDVAGQVHDVRRDGDRVVASAQEWPATNEPGTEWPNWAVDCANGDRIAIEPITTSGAESSVRIVERVGTRRFVGVSDAEGNVDFVNEDGVSIDGDDYAGYHSFDADGSRVAYTIVGGVSPHVGRSIRARDTTSGAVLWTAELDRDVTESFWVGDRVIVIAPSPDSLVDTSAIFVIDAATGEIVDTIETDVNVAFAR